MPTSDSLKYHVFIPRITNGKPCSKSISIRSVNVRFFRSRPSLNSDIFAGSVLCIQTNKSDSSQYSDASRNHSILSILTKLSSLPVSLYYMIIFDYAAHHVCYIFRRISYTVRIMHIRESAPLSLPFRAKSSIR